MDDVQNISLLKWISEPVDLKRYFETASQQYAKLKGNHTRGTDRTKIAGAMHLSEEKVASLEDSCSVDLLNCDDEVAPITRSVALDMFSEKRNAEVPIGANVIPEAGKSTLKTLQMLAGAREERSKKSKQFLLSKLKYQILSPPMVLNKPPDIPGPKIPLERDIVLTIRIHRSTNKRGSIAKRGNFIKLDQQFMVLGSQFLSELRDVIVCPKDNEPIYGSMEEEPIAGASAVSGDVFTSSLFFIEDTFYNDFRNPGNVDLSLYIRQWAGLAERVKPMKDTKMEETKFEDLTIRLGRPYLYMHQGNCEHLVVFANARLAHEDDPQDRSMYPVLNDVPYTQPIKCLSCKKVMSCWVVVKHEQLDTVPYFFCEVCFRDFNYSFDGKKNVPFVAYPYINAHAVL